jgi:hypothetical protein
LVVGAELFVAAREDAATRIREARRESPGVKARFMEGTNGGKGGWKQADLETQQSDTNLHESTRTKKGV